jgi:cytidylate kinase
MRTPARFIAIDGPAASGKSSTAAAVADALGLIHIDSGALYRTLTWLALREQSDNPMVITAAADRAGISLVRDGRSLAVRVDGAVVEDAIRSEAVTARVSAIAALPAVRDWVNRTLRAAVAREGGGVMDGRDIGTVVFPDAPLKVFLTATPEARAERRLRQREGGATPSAAALALEAADLALRDAQDAARAVAPLRRAGDARILDSTDLVFADQVAQILAWAGEIGLRPRG